ncbi:MAG: PTS sugar transporter subunit IIA [Planctomycetes bacterium]|nr:PTS sugar transporter subunit IIA [Planctomycetota bacterium]
MNFWKTFKPKSCSVHLQALSKEDALAEVVENLIGGESLPAGLKSEAVEALLARERLGSTGVGMGVAIPHVKLKGLERAACCLSVHTGGLEWHALDGAQVHLLFTVLRPDKPGENHDPQRHLEMMQWIARLAREPDFRRFALKVKTKTELVDLLKEMSTV